MRVLPDGSSCFTGIVGPRGPGFINFIKYEKIGRARRWLFVWRMLHTARSLSRSEPEGQWGWLRCLTYAVNNP